MDSRNCKRCEGAGHQVLAAKILDVGDPGEEPELLPLCEQCYDQLSALFAKPATPEIATDPAKGGKTMGYEEASPSGTGKESNTAALCPHIIAPEIPSLPLCVGCGQAEGTINSEKLGQSAKIALNVQDGLLCQECFGYYVNILI